MVTGHENQMVTEINILCAISCDMEIDSKHEEVVTRCIEQGLVERVERLILTEKGRDFIDKNTGEAFRDSR